MMLASIFSTKRLPLVTLHAIIACRMTRSTRILIYLFFVGAKVCVAQQSSVHITEQYSAKVKPEPMQIIEHPKDITVCVGGSAHFSVRVSGSDNPRFQWQSSVDGQYWTDIEGAQVSVFEGLKNLSKAYDGLKIRVLIKLSSGFELISQPATLTVDGNLACTRQPESQLIVEGGTLILQADFSSRTNIVYQWQYCPYGTLVWIDLPGQNEAQLKVENVRMEQSGGQFRLLARSIAGCDSVLTEAAFMEVVATPHIQLNRGQSTYCGGGSTTFTVKMRGGSGREKIQWQESRDAGKTYRNLTGAEGKSYTIDRITETMAGYKYRALVTLPGNLELYTTDITVTVHGAVAFNEQPKSQKICPGDFFQLSAMTDFKGSEPEYGWQQSLDSINFMDIAGAKTRKLEITTDPNDRRTRFYRAVVKAGPCQTMLSNIAKIEILSVDGKEPKVENQHVPAGQTQARFTSDFSGDSSIYTLTWQWSANDGATWQTIPSNEPNALTLKNISPEVEGTYLYRLKALNKVCARIYYSQPVRLIFEPNR